MRVLVFPFSFTSVRGGEHRVWSQAQAVFAAAGVDPEITTLELRVAEEVTGAQARACVAPQLVGPEEQSCRDLDVPAERRQRVLDTSHPVVEDAVAAFGEPVRAAFSANPSDTSRDRFEHPHAVVWVWRLPAHQLDEAYRIARESEYDVMADLHRSRVDMKVRQRACLPGGGWLELETELSATGCAVALSFEFHATSERDEGFLAFWDALQSVVGELKRDELQTAELVDGRHTNRESTYFWMTKRPVPKSVFKAPKDPYKKPAPKRKRTFLRYTGGISLPRGPAWEPRLQNAP